MTCLYTVNKKNLRNVIISTLIVIDVFEGQTY